MAVDDGLGGRRADAGARSRGRGASGRELRLHLGHVARLPSRQRQAVLLHHFGGLSHREVASTLNVSEGNARVILHRGLAALRDSLGRECLLDFGDPISCERR